MRRAPIRLGGQAARDAGTAIVLSLDAIGAQPMTVRSAIPLSEWRLLLRAVGFNEQEVRYLILAKLDRVPRRALPAHTRWPVAEVERLRVATQEKLRDLRSRAPSIADYREILTAGYGGVFRESLACGRVWSMRMSVSDPFSTKTISPEDVSGRFSKSHYSGSISIRPPLAAGELMELDKRLQAAELTTGRIFAQKQNAEEALVAAERKLGGAQRQLHTDEEAALLEGRPVSTKLGEQVTELRSSIPELARHIATCERAYTRACSDVEAIKGEIAAGMFERFRAAIASGAGPRLRKAMEEFVAASVEVYGLSRKFGFERRVEVLFPSELDDPISDASYRNHKVSLTNEALKFAAVSARVGRRKVG